MAKPLLYFCFYWEAQLINLGLRGESPTEHMKKVDVGAYLSWEGKCYSIDLIIKCNSFYVEMNHEDMDEDDLTNLVGDEGIHNLMMD